MNNKNINLSIVAAALLMASTLVSAADLTINTAVTTTQVVGALDANDVLITSSGRISVNTELALDVTSMANNSTITNNGNINTSRSDLAMGVNVSDVITDSSIINNANITSISTDSSAKSIFIEKSFNASNITNNGTITTNAGTSSHGINMIASVSNSNITNIGHISTTSTDQSYGIHVRATFSDSTISNTGNIMTTSTSNFASGIRIDSKLTNSSIINSGTIDSRAGTSSYGIYASALAGSSINNEGGIIESHAKNWAIGIKNSSFKNSSILTGTINVSSDNSTAWGISVSDMEGTSSITNSKTIDVKGVDSYGIYVSSSDVTTTITNDGRIITKGDKSIGIFNDGNALITNTGTITSRNNSNNLFKDGFSIKTEGDVSNTGTLNGNLDISGTLTNDGTINLIGTSTIGSLTGTGDFNVLEDATLRGTAIDMTGTITNAGTVEIAGTTNVGSFNQTDGMLTNTGTLNANTMNIEYARIDNTDSIINLLNGASTLANISVDGDLNIQNNAIANFDDITSTGTISNYGTINLTNEEVNIHTFNQSASSTLGIILDHDGTNFTNSTISVTDAIIADGSNFFVDVKEAANTNAGDILDTAFTVITASSSLSVDATTQNVTDNSALVNFVAWSANDIGGGGNFGFTAVQDETTSVLDQVLQEGNSGVEGAAAALDSLSGSTNPEVSEFNNYLGTLPSGVEIKEAVVSITPNIAISTQTAVSQSLNTMSKVVHVRQSGLRGMSSGDEVFGDENIWIKPFASYAKQENKDGINGFDANVVGIGVGLDGEYSIGNRAGLAFFYSQVNVDVNGVDQSSDIDVFSLIAYGSNDVIDDTTTVFYQLGYGIQNTDSTRAIIGLGETAKADYASKSYFAQLKITKEIELSKEFKATPSIYTSYTYFDMPSYSESGAGGMGLDVFSSSTKAFIVGAESDFAYKITPKINLIANIGLGYDFENSAQSVSSNFIGDGGTVFQTNGIENSDWIYKAGIGMNMKVTDDLSLDIKYDTDGRFSDFVTHTVSAYFNWSY